MQKYGFFDAWLCYAYGNKATPQTVLALLGLAEPTPPHAHPKKCNKLMLLYSYNI